MKRREQNQPSQDANTLNNVIFFAIKIFLVKFIKINYQRNLIDGIMLQAFTNFLDYISDRIFKQTELFTQKILKPVIDIISIVQFNLVEQYNRLTINIESVLRFFQSVFELSEKIFLLSLRGNNQKLTYITNIFWPLFNSKQKEPNISNLQNQIKEIKNIPAIYELQTKNSRFVTQNILMDLIGNFTSQNQKTFEFLFGILLSAYNEINRNLFQSILSFFQQMMSKGKSSQFQKCVKILTKLTNQIGDKYHYVQICMNRILKSQDIIKNFVNFVKIGQIQLQKYYTDDKILGLSLIILQNIMNQKFYDNSIVQAMKIISKLSSNFLNIQNYSDSKLQSFPLRFVQSIIKKKNSNPASSLSKIFQPLQDEKNRLDFQQEEGSLNQKLLLEYIKNVQNKSRAIQEQSQLQDGKNQFVEKICTEAKIILNNICLNKQFKSQIQINSFQRFSFVKNITSEPILDLISTVFPNILNINFKILMKNECELFNILIIKKAQQMNVKQLIQELDFRQFYSEVVNQNCLNFHFLLGMIYLKKLKLFGDQKDQTTHYLIGRTLSWLSEQQINETAIIMNLLMILQSADIRISSVQLRLKPFFKNYKLIKKPFTVTDFIQINARQNVAGNFLKVSVPQRFNDLIKVINSNLIKTQKSAKNLLMYLIIQFNNIAQKVNSKHQLPNFISQINLMKKNNNINNFYILSLSFNEYISRPEGEKSSIIIFHFLTKILINLQSNNFKNQGIRVIQTLLKNVKNYLLKLNSQIDFSYLNMLIDKRSLALSEQNSKKFSQLSKQAQVIKFYSQSKEKGLFLNCLISQQCLSIIKILLQVQKASLSSKIQQEGVQQIQIPEEQIYLEMTLPLKKLNLLYFPYQYDSKLSSMSRIMIQIGLLQTSDQDFKCNQIVQNLMKQSLLVSEIILNEDKFDEIWNFQFKGRQNIGQFLFSTIMRCFSAGNSKDNQIFNLACKILQNSRIQALAQKQIGQIFNQNLPKLISQRINHGILLPALQNIRTHLQTSSKLYKIVNKILKVSINQEQIVSTVISHDKIDNPSISVYILEELLNLSLFIKNKSQKITEDIFSYLMILNQNYPENKNQLQIPQFICSFFNLNNFSNTEVQLKNIEKSQKVVNCVQAAGFYRCLKCDDKKTICYGCWMQCHIGHPVIYLADSKPNRCQCKEIPLTVPTFKCLFGKKPQPVPAPVINNKNSVFNQPPPVIMGRGQRQPPHNVFSYVGRRESGQRRIYSRNQDWDAPPGLGAPLDFQDDLQGEDFRGRFGFFRNQRDFVEKDQGEKRYTTFTYEKSSSNNTQKIDSVKGKQEKVNQQDFTFEQENYSTYNQIQQEKNQQASSIIAPQSYLLPIFLQMFTQIASTQKQVKIQKKNFDYQKIMFDSMISEKILNSVWKATNPGNYNVRLRRQNHLQGKSPSISKSLIAQNPKFILIASGTMISTHLKQKFLTYLLEGKNLTTFPNLNQHSLTFDIHTIDFSPLDPFSFCVAGLHNINLLSINGQGLISKTNHRFNINNEYINKVRMSKLGIFLSTSNQIKLLNFTCKPILSIKSSTECLLKQWAVYQRATDCILYSVTSNGHTQFIQISPSDQGKKVFTNKIVDSRKKIDTGASILVKDCEQAGKIMIGSFKDGSNIIGRLQGDTLENISNFNIKLNHTDVFGKKIIMGHLQAIKGGDKELFVIATIKQLLNNQNTMHQGQLTVFKIRSDGKCSFQLVNIDNRCEHFIVVPIQEKNWAILSIHDDGSLSFSTLNKPNKTNIEAQCKRIRQIQPSSDQKASERNQSIRAQMKRLIKQDILKNTQLNPNNLYRQFSDALKVNMDIKVIKITNEQYEIKLENSSKIITGFSLPFLGNVILPHRTVKSTVQFGLSNLQALYYFAQGSIRFKVQKVQNVKIPKDALNHKFMQKLQKLQRLQRMQRLQKMNELSYDGEKASQLLSSINQAQLIQEQIIYYGLSFDIFKSRIHKFDQIFLSEQTSKNNDQQLQKMAMILTIFFKDSIQKENYLCQSNQIIDFVKSIRKLSQSNNQKSFQILKNLMVLALKMYQDMNGIKLHVFNDDLHPLKFATEDKMEYYYSLLKSQISDTQIQQITNFLIMICEENINLLILYLAKYPSLLPKLQKKCKKIQSEKVNSQLLTFFIIGYQVLKYKNHECEWILPAISSIIGTFIKNKELRKKFYLSLKNYYNLTLQGWVKNVMQIDGQQKVKEPNLVQNSQPRQDDYGGLQLNMLNYQLGMGEMDEQAMLRMALEMSQMDYKRQQQEHFNIGSQNLQQPIQEQKQYQPQQQLIMEQQLSEKTSKTNVFLTDLIQQLSNDLNQSIEIVIPKIATFYVVGKFIIQTQDPDLFSLILKTLLKFLHLLTPGGKNYDKHITISYFSLFNRLFINGESIIKKNPQCSELYEEIKKDVINKLSQLPIENVVKMSTVPCLLGRILKGQKPFTFSHYAYGLTSLLLPPCQPNHILLSLECYWLLPQSKEFYSKMKYKSTILDCMSGGNIKKMYEVANQHPQIWRQCGEVQWIQKWVQQRQPEWQKALDLLTLYYGQ